MATKEYPNTVELRVGPCFALSLGVPSNDVGKETIETMSFALARYASAVMRAASIAGDNHGDGMLLDAVEGANALMTLSIDLHAAAEEMGAR